MRSMRDGRSPHLPTVALMGFQGGEGKSFLFAPLKNVFGAENVQLTPQPGSFPLIDLEKKKIALLDEWSFDEAAAPFSTQLLWLEGKPFPITRPQNKDYLGAPHVHRLSTALHHVQAGRPRPNFGKGQRGCGAGLVQRRHDAGSPLVRVLDVGEVASSAG